MSKLANLTIVIGVILVVLSGVLFFNQSAFIKTITLITLVVGSVSGIVLFGFITKTLLKKVNQNLHQLAKQQAANQKK